MVGRWPSAENRTVGRKGRFGSPGPLKAPGFLPPAPQGVRGALTVATGQPKTILATRTHFFRAEPGVAEGRFALVSDRPPPPLGGCHRERFPARDTASMCRLMTSASPWAASSSLGCLMTATRCQYGQDRLLGEVIVVCGHCHEPGVDVEHVRGCAARHYAAKARPEKREAARPPEAQEAPEKRPAEPGSRERNFDRKRWLARVAAGLEPRKLPKLLQVEANQYSTNARLKRPTDFCKACDLRVDACRC